MTRICIIGEAYGRNEAAIGQPFVGATGLYLNRLCEEAGLIPPGSARQIAPTYGQFYWRKRDEIFRNSGIYLTNVLNEQPPGNKIEAFCIGKYGDNPPIRAGKYLAPPYLHHLERLKSELAQHKSNLILGMGATALWFVLGITAITKMRGAVASSKYGKFLPTFHPSYLMQGKQHLRPVVLMDLLKAARESHFPEIRRPERFVYIPEDLNDISWAMREMATGERLSVDIETVEDQITCIGFAWTPQHALVIPIWDFSKSDRSYWGHNEEIHVWHCIREILALPIPKVFQNGLFDIHFLWRRYGITPVNCADDTMLLHHALQPEMQKSLGFMGSIYSDEPAWKLMRPKGKGTLKKEDAE